MSGSQYLLDTNIVVPFLNGDAIITEKLKALTIVQLPFIVLGELYYGAYKSKQSKNNIPKIKEFIDEHCEVYYASGKTLELYGQIKQSLSKRGKPIPENDIWIAAIAWEYDLTLVTRDKHFSHVDKLNTATW